MKSYFEHKLLVKGEERFDIWVADCKKLFLLESTGIPHEERFEKRIPVDESKFNSREEALADMQRLVTEKEAEGYICVERKRVG